MTSLFLSDPYKCAAYIDVLEHGTLHKIPKGVKVGTVKNGASEFFRERIIANSICAQFSCEQYHKPGQYITSIYPLNFSIGRKRLELYRI